MLSVIWRESLRAVTRNPLRSSLTMLGIIMGVASFICMVALGNAGTSRVEEQLKNVGDNLIWVEAGSRSRNGLRLGSRNTKSLVAADVVAIRDEIPLIKSASLSIAGGLIGVAMGYLSADLLQNTLDWPVLVTPNTAIVAAGFSVSIGMLFGYYPAYRASQMDPIHCLRQD